MSALRIFKYLNIKTFKYEDVILVRGERIELSRDYSHWGLNPVRLPFRHPRNSQLLHGKENYSTNPSISWAEQGIGSEDYPSSKLLNIYFK